MVSITETLQQALEELRQARLNQPKRSSREAYAQMERMLEAQRKSSGTPFANGQRVKG